LEFWKIFVTLTYLSQWPTNDIIWMRLMIHPKLRPWWLLWICSTHVACLWTNLDPKCTNHLCIWFVIWCLWFHLERGFSFLGFPNGIMVKKLLIFNFEMKCKSRVHYFWKLQKWHKFCGILKIANLWVPLLCGIATPLCGFVFKNI